MGYFPGGGFFRREGRGDLALVMVIWFGLDFKGLGFGYVAVRMLRVIAVRYLRYHIISISVLIA